MLDQEIKQLLIGWGATRCLHSHSSISNNSGNVISAGAEGEEVVCVIDLFGVDYEPGENNRRKPGWLLRERTATGGNRMHKHQLTAGPTVRQYADRLRDEILRRRLQHSPIRWPSERAD